MKDLNMLIISDTHCGNSVGLTPSGFERLSLQRSDRRKRHWQTFRSLLRSFPPIDVLIGNGDMIDGKQKRWAGTGLLTADLSEQLDMAQCCIEAVGAKEIHLVRGTPYHTSGDMDYEDELAKRVHADSICNHKQLVKRGVVFDFKHKINSSGVVTGRFTALAQERVWNVEWARRKKYLLADVIVRSHVHYFGQCGGFEHSTMRKWLGITTPALMSLGDKYGTLLCKGTVDWGMILFTIKNKNNFTFQEYIRT